MVEITWKVIANPATDHRRQYNALMARAARRAATHPMYPDDPAEAAEMSAVVQAMQGQQYLTAVILDDD